MATVDDLLRRLHRQAAGLRVSSSPDRQVRAHLRAWVPLAKSAERVLEALDPRPEDRELYGLLRALGRAGLRQTGRPDASLERLALTVGALGDVIAGFPEAVAEAGQPQRWRLQASVQAALHAAARTTLNIARTAGQQRTVEVVRKVAEATELAALLPPSARASNLERLAVSRLTTGAVDGAVQLWADVAQWTFTNDRLVTGIALQEAAATLALLGQVTSGTLREAARRQVVDPGAARNAAQKAGVATAAWREAAAWPSSVELGGRADEHHRAVRAVREALTGPPLGRLTLRERVHTLHAAMSAAVVIGELQAATIARVAKHGGLWIAHERPNLRPPGVERRHVKLDWETMDPNHPAGRVLTDLARSAEQCWAAAADATNRAVLPSPTAVGESGQITLVENRVVVDWWETAEPATTTHRPEDHGLRTSTLPHPGIPR